MAYTPEEFDYSFIKQQGIEYIEQLAGKKWTDYGEHDPGITILEVLAMAIVDLAYRTNFHVEDLFAQDPLFPDQEDDQQFFRAEEILPCNPLTQWDFLKVVLDVPGVKNANITLSDGPNEIRGGYKVFVEFEERIKDTLKEQEILNRVKKRLYAQRNLCEDFFVIQTMNPLVISLQAVFEVSHHLDYEEGEKLIANMLFEMQELLSPRINFYNISQLLKKGKTIDQIFTGPLLNQGFIDEEELIALKKKSKIYITDLLKRATMGAAINGALSFELFVEGEKFSSNDVVLPVVVDRSLFFDIEQSKITLLYNRVPINIDWEKVKFFLEETKGHRALTKSYWQDEEIFVLKGEYRNLKNYYSIQHDFPLLYNVGHEGCTPSETPENHAKAKQLKGFLMFFDQIFANYFGQLANIRHMMAFYGLSWCNPEGRLPLEVPRMESIVKRPTSDKNPGDDLEFVIQRKYLNLRDTVSLSKDEVVSNETMRVYLEYVNKVLDNDVQILQKRSKMLDHLLAYFSERFLTNALGIYTNDEQMQLKDLIEKKAFFLKNYAELSKNRGLGVALQQKYGTDTVSGFERYLGMRLGIKNFTKYFLYELLQANIYVQAKSKQSEVDVFLEKDIYDEHRDVFIFKGNYTNIHSLALAYGLFEDYYYVVKTGDGTYKILLYVDKAKEHTIELQANQPIYTLEQAEKIIQEMVEFFITFNEQSEGFHLIEHIFLRTSDQLEGDKDPYSFIMTIVFPTWPSRFQKSSFRNFVEELIILESPAHIFTNILWLDFEQMEAFELAYKRWLELKNSSFAIQLDIDAAANNVLNLINRYSNTLS